MTVSEAGFLMLTSHLGDPDRKPLTTAQMRTLSARVSALYGADSDGELEFSHLTAMGYSAAMSNRILHLLDSQEQLDAYLRHARGTGCVPLTRVNKDYPSVLRRKLYMDAPGSLWLKGDPEILQMKAVSAVGSRDLLPPNRCFAEEVGRQAAAQGYVLVSGNARGADRTAQNACLKAGGRVICVVADSLAAQRADERILYISEDGYNEAFSSFRALSRNRIIHALGCLTFVAQCTLGSGGTWSGCLGNFRNGLSPVFCFRDGSEATAALAQMGAELISMEHLKNIGGLKPAQMDLFG